MNTLDPDSVPVFDLRKIVLPREDDFSEPWSDEEEYIPASVDLSEDFPVIQLPFILLPNVTLKSDDNIRRVLHRIQGGIYDRLPPDVKDAVAMTLPLNNSVQEFFSKSVWRLFLQQTRELKSKRKHQRNK